MTWGLFPRDVKHLTRGGRIDALCLGGLISHLVNEIAEVRAEGSLSDYLEIGNIADISGYLLLAITFVVRMVTADHKTDPVNETEVYEGEWLWTEPYSPESVVLAGALLICWFRTLSRVAKEFESTAVLIAIIKQSFLTDLVPFFFIMVVYLAGITICGAALYTKVLCFEDNNSSSAVPHRFSGPDTNVHMDGCFLDQPDHQVRRLDLLLSLVCRHVNPAC